MKFHLLVVGLFIPLIDSKSLDPTSSSSIHIRGPDDVSRKNSSFRKNRGQTMDDAAILVAQLPRPFTTMGTFLAPSHSNPSISPHRTYNSSAPTMSFSPPSMSSPSSSSDSYDISISLKPSFSTSKSRNSSPPILSSSPFISSSVSNDPSMSLGLASQRPSAMSISYNVPYAPIRLRGKSVRETASLPAPIASTILPRSLNMSSSTDKTPNFISSLFLVPSRLNSSRLMDDEEPTKNDYEFFIVKNRKNKNHFDRSEVPPKKEFNGTSNISLFSLRNVVQSNSSFPSFKYLTKSTASTLPPPLSSSTESSTPSILSSTLDRAETTLSSSLKNLKNKKKSVDQKFSFRDNKSFHPKDKVILAQIITNTHKIPSTAIPSQDIKSRYSAISISSSCLNSSTAPESPDLIMSNHGSGFLSTVSALKKTFSTLSPLHKASFNVGVKPKPPNQQQKHSPSAHNPPRHLPPLSFLSTSLRSSFSSRNSFPPHSFYPHPLSSHSLQETQFDPSSPANISAQLGSSAYLPCKIRNLGNKTVSWIRSRDAHILTVDRYTFIADERFQAWHEEDSDTWTLMIKYVQERDDGRYECQVSTEPKMSRFVYFQVVSPIVRIPGGSDIHVKVGSTVALKCVISAALKQPEYLFWYQDNERVVSSQNSGGRQIFLDRIANDSLVGTLIIPHATPKDAGLYQCVPEKLKTANVTLHVINGEHPAAMQHGTSVMTCPGSPELLLATLTFVILVEKLISLSCG